MELAIRGRLAIYYDHTGKLIFTKDPLIIVEDNQIVDIDSFKKNKQNISGHDVIGNDNQLLLPGLVNCHTHLSMTLFRGIADDLPLEVWLKDHIWPLERKLSKTDVYFGAKLGAIESLISGVTTTSSMYWHPEQEALAMSDMGLRGMIGAPVLTEIVNLSDSFKLVEEHHDTADSLIRVNITPHAPYTATASDYRQSFLKVKEYNEKNTGKPLVLMHTHLAEAKDELEQCRAFNIKHGENFPNVKTIVEYFQEIGILNNHLLAAHCIHLTEKDIDLLSQNKVGIALNPVSNSKLGNMMPRVKEMINKKCILGLGTDGPASNNTLDLFDTIRYLGLYYKGHLQDSTAIKASQIFKMATLGGMEALHWPGIGTLEKNTLADIITINLKKPHLTPVSSDNSIISHFAYSMKGNDVENVIINGKVITENRNFESQDEERVMEEVEKRIYRLLSE